MEAVGDAAAEAALARLSIRTEIPRKPKATNE